MVTLPTMIYRRFLTRLYKSKLMTIGDMSMKSWKKYKTETEFFLAQCAEEMRGKENALKAGNIQKARHHEVMAETYKSIAERCFAV